MKVKIIDLLNKVANGELVPDKIIYDNVLYKFYGCAYRDDNGNTLGQNTILDLILDKEVEIIEDNNKIEKIDVNSLQTIKKWKRAKILGNKINEIIEVINEVMDE